MSSCARVALASFQRAVPKWNLGRSKMSLLPPDRSIWSRAKACDARQLSAPADAPARNPGPKKRLTFPHPL